MKKNIGYLPRFDQARETITKILDFFEEEKSIYHFTQFFEENYGSKSDSTIRLTVNTLVNYGLLVETEDYVYKVSATGTEWMKDPAPMKLIKILDEHVEFIGELMLELRGTAHTAEELIAIAKQKYEVYLGSSDFSRRCQVLKSENLIKMNRRRQYSLTAEGEKFLKILDGCEEPKVPIRKELPKRATAENISNTKKRDIQFRQTVKKIMEFLLMAKSKPYIYQGGVLVREVYGMLDEFYPDDYENMKKDTQDAFELLAAPGIEAVIRGEEGKYRAAKTWKEAEERIEFYAKLIGRWRMT